jgi:hypothetical protein
MATLQIGAFILKLESAIVSGAGTAVSATLTALGASFITLIGLVRFILLLLKERKTEIIP